jgi:hypothetical protein
MNHEEVLNSRVGGKKTSSINSSIVVLLVSGCFTVFQSVPILSQVAVRTLVGVTFCNTMKQHETDPVLLRISRLAVHCLLGTPFSEGSKSQDPSLKPSPYRLLSDNTPANQNLLTTERLQGR